LLIEQNREFSPTQEEQDQNSEQATGCPLLVKKPIGFGDIPEATPQASVEVLDPFRLSPQQDSLGSGWVLGATMADAKPCG
jgi:hypothetical protein